MTSFPTILIPAYEFHFNLVVCPLPKEEVKTGQSFFFVLKDNGTQAIPTGGTHWLSYLPDHMYCFLPSFQSDKGQVEVLDYIPGWLRDFSHYLTIGQIHSHTKIPSPDLTRKIKPDETVSKSSQNTDDRKKKIQSKCYKKSVSHPQKRWETGTTRKVNAGCFFKLDQNLPPKNHLQSKFVKRKPALGNHTKMERNSEKGPKIKKPQPTLDDSLDILSCNKFASLNSEEIAEDEDINGNFNHNKANIEQGNIKNKLKAPRKKIAKKKKKQKTMRIETIKSSFDCKESTETFRCHICNRSESKLKGKNDKRSKRNKSETSTALLDLETLLYCIAFLEFKHATSKNSSTSNQENKQHGFESIRRRGGAGNNGSSTSTLIGRAIESAKKHGISLEQGKLNKADGNCSFDAVINNINHRDCFKEKLLLSSEVYRQIWVTELEMKSSKYPRLGAGYSQREKKENWNLLKQSGVYEVEFFGDFVMHAIAKGCNKNILIFNTSAVAAGPIYVIRATEFDGFTDSDIPVVVGYDQTHYESLHPSTDADILKTNDLVNSFLAGTYGYHKNDFPFLFASTNNQTTSNVDIDNFETEFPQLPPTNKNILSKSSSLIIEKEKEESKPTPHGSTWRNFSDTDTLNNFLKLQELTKIKKKDRTEAQQSLYSNLMKLQRKEKRKKYKEGAKLKESLAEKLENNMKDKERKAAARSKETPQERLKRTSKSRETMAELRSNETTEETLHRTSKDRESRATVRSNETPQERLKRTSKDQETKASVRSKVRSMPSSMYEARNAQRVLFGEQIVKDLEEGEDGIGSMNVKCAECGALKWKTETATLCCNNGKVDLTVFPEPPPYLKYLWTANTIEARLFREQSRPFNNALALSSIKVTERRFDSGYSPSVVFEGKVQQLYGPLIADLNETPRFSQLYVHDPATEDTLRIENMNLPRSLTKKQIETVKNVMKKLQKLMKEVNPYVKDFMHICEIPDANIKEGKLVICCKERPKGAHERTYNKQTSLSEVSILTNSEPGDIVLRKREGGLQFVYDLHPAAQPLHFTLLFPFGTKGYDEQTKHVKGDKTRRVTPREFFAFHLNMRCPTSDFLFRGRRLFQEYLCMAYTIIENQKLKFQRKNQKALRADTYKNVKDVISDRSPMTDKIYEDDHKLKFGKRIVLSKSFVGSPRWYNNQFQDGMAICREHHKPDFFLTMTCNPHWQEIKRELQDMETAQDRPDIVARVFKQKKDKLIRDINFGKVLGKVPAFLWVIEFQKRGLPHMHMLVILSDDDRLSSSVDVDNVISAELPPDPSTFPFGSEERKQAERLESIVLTNMVHGPCGKYNPNSPCMADGICTKNFPKPFCDRTKIDPDNTYPEYRRQSPEKGGRSIVVIIKGKEYVIDNSWIVPYSPFFCLRFDCHFNIELCLSPTAAKYLYKYVYKGSDRAMVRVEIEDTTTDEIGDYEDMRSVGSSEAAWQIFSFNITKKHPAVYALRCHLEDEQHVIFDEETAETDVENQRTAELTGFFEFNRNNSETSTKYVDFPKRFVWKNKEWKVRKASFDTIGRVHAMNPAAGDVYFLRMLLHHDHCAGKGSFEELRTMDGEVQETYQEVCRLLGLLQDDKEWDNALTEGSFTKLSSALRELFVTILMFCMPANPRELFDNHFLEWSDDFKRDGENNGCVLSDDQLRTLVLTDLKHRLQSWERDLKTFGLHEPSKADLESVNFKHEQDSPVLIREELNFNKEELRKLVNDRIVKFTESQRDVFQTAIEAVENKNFLCLFIDARGGTGKTFVMNAILAAVRLIEEEKGGSVALAVGTTGIAANLLHLGRTFHSRFKAPLDPREDSILSINAQSSLAELVRMAKIIVLDEAPMLHKYYLEALDRSLQDIEGNEKPFGGKILVLSGDFRQCLAVLKNASSAAVVDAALNRSYLWKHFKVMQLKENMRVKASGNPLLEEFDNWTLSIGNGDAATVEDTDMIEIPEEMCLRIEEKTAKNPDAEKEAMKALTDQVYPNLHSNILASGWMDGRAILAPTNKQVDAINNLIMDAFPGQPSVLSSSDELSNASDLSRFNIEYLNSLSPSGLPIHRLFLKPGMPLMLLRNLNPKMGLCNGTRLIFHKVHNNHLLECSIVGGEFNTRKVLIPRITLMPRDREFTFEWSRRQFPVRVCFAMTINKSQGQTLQNVGIWLNDSCFAHGQLYVAVSRVGCPSRVKFAIRRSHGHSATATRNVVYKEVFRNLLDN